MLTKVVVLKNIRELSIVELNRLIQFSSLQDKTLHCHFYLMTFLCCSHEKTFSLFLYPMCLKQVTRQSFSLFSHCPISASFSSIQLLSHVQFCNSMDCSTQGFSAHHQLLELAQTHVHRVGDAIQPSHPLLSIPFSSCLSQHQGLFQSVSSSHQVSESRKYCYYS